MGIKKNVEISRKKVEIYEQWKVKVWGTKRKEKNCGGRNPSQGATLGLIDPGAFACFAFRFYHHFFGSSQI